MNIEWIWAGLGNPGERYCFTRHNIGFLVLDYWAREKGISFKPGPFNTEIAISEKILLVKPLTFMNCSGEALLPLLQRLSLAPNKLLVIHDDLDLPLGRFKLSPQGGSGGHRGIDSIIKKLGIKKFPRLRLGIGRPQDLPTKDYVLSPFTQEEWPVVEKVIQRAAQILDFLKAEGLDKCMSIFNQEKFQISK